MTRSTETIIQMFNEITLKEYAKKRNENSFSYSDEEVKKILQTAKGPISLGAVYKWPTSTGDKTHVIGFGLMSLKDGLSFVVSFNSKREGRAVMGKIEPSDALRMIEWGEVEYLGNIFDVEFRKNFDYERLSLAIMGFITLAKSIRLQQNYTIDDLLGQLENGEVTLDGMLDDMKGLAI